METSVFKEILFHSINGSKIYDGTIDWLEGLETHSLIVRSSGGYDGLGSIDGFAFNIGNNVPINFIGSVNANFNSVTIGEILLSGDMTFSENSLNTFYSNYIGTKSVVDGMVANSIDTITSFTVDQLLNLASPSTISSLQWSYLSAMQDVESGANVTFGSIISGAINATTLTTSSFITASGIITGTQLRISGGSYGINEDGDLKAYDIDANNIIASSLDVTGSGSGDIKGKSITGTSLDVSTGSITSGDITSSGIIAAENGFKVKMSPPISSCCGISSLGIGLNTITTSAAFTNSRIFLTVYGTVDATVRVINGISNGSFQVNSNAICQVNWLIINTKT